ncbi:hypothetical protein A3D00_04480 [Candidatus Woesebacteria bacterium RIFCSPHIGHO2_02_FULL_38_9]|uniref:GrpB family protein n=1 Tax=Candidatus Woesebacteria bacterium RIFCSPHIGHO2_01_FULL_39_28 TaxID=1802496 RepID=A0A1F7YIN0_9BACT|nr:MAG: hypothetical protein A2627_05835 [Candidatus Woesebacteria bacterium RIFCSPHIGHO2_01_FULL_39_28]OGM34947.1 MAG: hypothetical protein A3D00_04480 [Candidatus Woesebacteria bacterium RIFCSPHIGHO2_02_FULL_38_9]OGM57450.1 MAG: hypothetical protein A3A50_05970 [Candidatus Woesebacteria bacterium RIFCSPLOWO2_01_FULL_38_20]
MFNDKPQAVQTETDETLTKKYSYQDYDPRSPSLFEKERDRLNSLLERGGVKDIIIEHFGSSAVPGLGGKSVIDTYIAVPRDKMQTASDLLKTSGYVYDEAGSSKEQERLFHTAVLPDGEGGTKTYHTHITFHENGEPGENFRLSMAFRDYLRNHPEEAEIYAKAKKDAATAAAKLYDEGKPDEARRKYMEIKTPVIARLLDIISKDFDNS